MLKKDVLKFMQSLQNGIYLVTIPKKWNSSQDTWAQIKHKFQDSFKSSFAMWIKNPTKFSYIFLFLVIYKWKKHPSELC